MQILLALIIIFLTPPEVKRAPNFTLESIEGEEVVLDSLLGEGPIYLSFWALWCKACIRELDKMRPVYEKYKDRGFRLLTINEDSPRSYHRVKPFVKAKKWDYIVLLDKEQEAMKLFQVKFLPTTFILDKEGNIFFTHYGFKPGDEKILEEEIKSLISTEDEQ